MYDSISDPTFDHGAVEGLALGDFLSRPVLIETKEWGVGTQLADTLDPWTAFLTNTSIKSKIENYGLLRMKLKVKLILSASPFYYGLGMMSYNPTPNSHTGPHPIPFTDYQLVTYSQRPHVYFNVTDSMGGEMELPFFWPYNWLRNDASGDEADIVDMGELRLDSFGPLRNCNGVVDNLTIKIYAWAEDVELSGPTGVPQSSYTKKSKADNSYKRQPKKSQPKRASIRDNLTAFGSKKDEYGDGPVSGVASAVAAAAGALSNVPIIGAYARATEIGAGAVSRIASFFGFTKVPVIANVNPVKDLPFGNFASAVTSEPAAKLTLDPKCELTLDSRTVGLDGTDELALEHYVSRESYLTGFEWTADAASDAVLFGIRIDPSHFFRRVLDEPYELLYPTPLSHASMAYAEWTGTVILRFQVVCSVYHRGRLKIQWDPLGNITGNVQTTVPSDTYNITRIYDLQETQDIEMCVPWMQSKPFAPTIDTMNNLTTIYDECFASGTSAAPNGPGNGYLAVSVANQLTSPDGLADVRVVVSVRAGDDFTLLNPRGVPNTLQWYAQSEYVAHAPEGVEADCLNGTTPETGLMPLIFGGETNISIRQLLQRQQFWRVDATGNNAGLSYLIFNKYIKPMYPFPNGECATFALDTSVSGPYNYVANTYFNWFTTGFAGKRGSMVWAQNLDSADDVCSVQVSRSPGQESTSISYNTSYEVADATAASDMRYYSVNGVNMQEDGAGSALYNMRTQTGVTTLIPFVSPERFSHTTVNPLAHTSEFPHDSNDLSYKTITTTHSREADSRTVNLFSYVGTGPDFNCFFFTGIPTLKILAVPLPA
eukprot:GHVU01009544.1.p1 GENE.GHVU01009544.1~~GHVU01009544.1.p1  ORF type:complete len:827 (+),score=34.07 GHVU01009544.1:583-3063(+)